MYSPKKPSVVKKSKRKQRECLLQRRLQQSKNQKEIARMSSPKKTSTVKKYKTIRENVITKEAFSSQKIQKKQQECHHQTNRQQSKIQKRQRKHRHTENVITEETSSSQKVQKRQQCQQQKIKNIHNHKVASSFKVSEILLTMTTVAMRYKTNLSSKFTVSEYANCCHETQN